jgi:hypothetical protein
MKRRETHWVIAGDREQLFADDLNRRSVTMTDLQNRLAEAKARLSAAAKDCIAGAPGAALRADAALAEVQMLQALIRVQQSERAIEK